MTVQLSRLKAGIKREANQVQRDLVDIQANIDNLGIVVNTVAGGTNVTVDNTDTSNPIVNVPSLGVESITAGTLVTLAGTATVPIINVAVAGASGSFTTVDSKTVTVVDGLITTIV